MYASYVGSLFLCETENVGMCLNVNSTEYQRERWMGGRFDEPEYKLQDTGKAIEIGLESFDKRVCAGSNLPKQCLEKEPSVKKKREALLL